MGKEFTSMPMMRSCTAGGVSSLSASARLLKVIILSPNHLASSSSTLPSPASVSMAAVT